MTNNRENIINNPIPNWKNIFKVLKIIGTITPGIWAQANSINFNEGLKKQAEKYSYHLGKLNIPLVSSQLH